MGTHKRISIDHFGMFSTKYVDVRAVRILFPFTKVKSDAIMRVAGLEGRNGDWLVESKVDGNHRRVLIPHEAFELLFVQRVNESHNKDQHEIAGKISLLKGSEDEAGDDEAGDDEAGDDETGDDETGDDETGEDEAGDDETGDDETGDDETGDDEKDNQ